MSEVNDTILQNLLPEYYKRLFPHYLMCKWLGYSTGKFYLSLFYLSIKISIFFKKNSSKRLFS